MRPHSVLLACAIGVTAHAQYPVVNVDSAQVFALCYESFLDTGVTFQATAPGPVWLHICAGEIEACCDGLEVYDGLDQFAPLLYMSMGFTSDLTDLDVVSSGPDYALTCRIVTNDSIDCWSQGYVPIIWSVGVAQPYPCTLGTYELAQETAMVLFPDPADDQLHVRMTSGALAPSRVQVLDLTGRVILDKAQLPGNATSLSLDVGDLRSGQYVLLAYRGAGRTVRSFTVMH